MILKLHKQAAKNLKRAPNHIAEKAFRCVLHLRDHGMRNCPFPIEPLKGEYKKFQYFEAKIHKDFRIFFRYEDDVLHVRHAGTHNQLGTG